MRKTCFLLAGAAIVALGCSVAAQQIDVVPRAVVAAAVGQADVSVTITMTPAQAARVNAALVRFADEQEFPDETDKQRYKRWLKDMHRNLVYRHEREQAESSVAADLEPGVSD